MYKLQRSDRDLFLIGQIAMCQRLEIAVTPYLASKWLKCTPPTARKILSGMQERELIMFEIDHNHPRTAQCAKLRKHGYDLLRDNKAVYVDILLSVFVRLIRKELS